ncbi:hypothetical protein vseg_011106 [Gypsophila vaccaria]
MASGSHSKHKKKRSQKHSKKKSKRITDKTKKRKRRNDLVSSSDEGSMSDSSVSCRSSEGDYKSKRRARSRDRKDRKDRKKRAKRPRSVSESSGDDSPRVKKRKRSKMSKDIVSKKKRHGKKRRRSPSVSSLSGRSRSLSSGEFSVGSEREFPRKEGKEEKRGEKGKERKGSKRREKHKEMTVNKSKHRSRSWSPRSLRSGSHSYDSEDRVIEVNNPKRLKSVIVVAHYEEETEIRDSNWDGNKAEIVFEHDDYPSRSNDSNDGVSRREASSFSHDVNSGKLGTFDDSNLETVPSDVQTSEIPENQKLVGETPEGINLKKLGSPRANDNLTEASTEIAVSSSDDLAAVLRQKALENFLKRQGKSLTKNSIEQTGDGNLELNSSSSLMTDQVQLTSDVHSAFKSVPKLGKADDVDCPTDVPSSTKGKIISLPRRVLGISRPAEKYTAPSGFADSRSNLGLSLPKKEFIGAKNTWRRQVVSQESSSLNNEETVSKDSKQKVIPGDSSLLDLSTPKNLTGMDSKRQIASAEVSQRNLSVLGDSIDLGSSRGCLESTVNPEKVEGDVASKPSSMVGNSSIENTNEAGGDSQFQQKTMTVMRGGEMVQVSYKVYIPNKAPALARRQLKR